MLRVLDLDPAITPAAAVSALAVFRDQAFEPHQAGMPAMLAALADAGVTVEENRVTTT
jgi:hypothetical protein